MASPLCGCDWPHVIPLFRDPSCGRGLSVALISHTVLGQLTSRACSTKRRLTKGSPSPPRLQGPGRGRPALPPTTMALCSLQGLHLKPASHTREVLSRGWEGHRVMTCLKAWRLRPRKMKCEIVNVCLEGGAGITELSSAGSGGFSRLPPVESGERRRRWRSQSRTCGGATAGRGRRKG